MRFLLGDRVKLVNSALVGQGKIVTISEGGKYLGFPWDDDTPHYEFIDENTGTAIFAHEKNLIKLSDTKE